LLPTPPRLFLVNDLHVSLTTAGLFYLTNITAPLAGYLIGARSDRSGKRLGLFRWCALAGFLGWAAMALADQAWMPFVISAVVLAFSGAAGSQLFAAVHDDLHTTASPVADGVLSIVRMALTAGWVIGPDRLSRLHELHRHRQRPRRADRQLRHQRPRPAARVLRPGTLRTHHHQRDRRHEPFPVRRPLARLALLRPEDLHAENLRRA